MAECTKRTLFNLVCVCVCVCLSLTQTLPCMWIQHLYVLYLPCRKLFISNSVIKLELFLAPAFTLSKIAVTKLRNVMIPSSKHARNRTKQEFWGLDKFQQTDTCYKTDGEKRDSFWETPTIFHHHRSTALSGVGYRSLPNFFASVFSGLPPPPLHSRF